MSKLSDSIKNSMRDKALRLTKGDPTQKVDSSTWTPPEAENAGVKTGLRPLSKRQYKSGGKVHGANAKKRADRMMRKSGGRTEAEDRSKRYLTPDNLLNRDVRMANEERAGTKHIGGFKKGGKIKREHHADGDVVGDMIRQDQIQQAMKGRGLPSRVPLPPRRPVVAAPMPRERIPVGASPTFKKGGKAMKHDDVAADKALIKKMVKRSAMKRDEHCWGGEAKSKKADGGKIGWLNKGKEVFSGNSTTKIPGKTGGRTAKAYGGPMGAQPQQQAQQQPLQQAQQQAQQYPQQAQQYAQQAQQYPQQAQQYAQQAQQYPQQAQQYTNPYLPMPSGMEQLQRLQQQQAQQYANPFQNNMPMPGGMGGGMKQIEQLQRLQQQQAQLAQQHPQQPQAQPMPGGMGSQQQQLQHLQRLQQEQMRNMPRNFGQQPAGMGMFGGCMGGGMPGGMGMAAYQQPAVMPRNFGQQPAVMPQAVAYNTGGRTAHAKGGKTKGKTNININVMPHHPGMGGPMGGPVPMGGAPMPPPPPPPGPPMGGPPPMGPPPGGPMGGPPMPPPGMPPMPRKSGGRAGKDLGGSLTGGPSGSQGMGGLSPQIINALKNADMAQKAPAIAGGGMTPQQLQALANLRTNPQADLTGAGALMGRKHGGRAMAKTEHVIDHAAGGGLGRLEKIKAYGQPQKRIK